MRYSKHLHFHTEEHDSEGISQYLDAILTFSSKKLGNIWENTQPIHPLSHKSVWLRNYW